MKIIHAVSNEHGRANGGLPGDQTGKEIREANWYDRPWEVYIEPKDREIGEKAVEIANRICDGDYGYSQEDRWSGYKAINAYGFESTGDFDCSSLCISCYIFAGMPLKAEGYTKTLEKIFLNSGMFRSSRDEKVLHDPSYAVMGGMYLAPGKHVCMCIENGENAQSVPNVPHENQYIGYITPKGSVRARLSPRDGKTVRILHKGDHIGILTEDYETGWVYTDYGWVTNNPQYVSITFND